MDIKREIPMTFAVGFADLLVWFQPHGPG